MTERLDIRPMDLADLELTLSWARSEGWNPGLSDAPAFLAADPSGFLMGWQDGQPAGAISVVKYDESLAFLGLYIVAPPFRGRGLGRALWDRGIASAGNRTIGLDGVVAQQENYVRSGFAFRHRSIRFGGTARAVGRASARPGTGRLAAASAVSVAALDRRLFPSVRTAFLQAWLDPGAGRTAIGWFENGACKGYGAIRPCVEGYKIGPLFALSPTIAGELMEALMGSVEEGPVWIDVPEPNEEGIALASRLGLRPGFETARMYRGPAPVLDLEAVYGVTTLELG